MARVVRSVFASVFSMMISLAPVVAQQEAPSTNPATSTSPQKLTKEQKKKMGRALKELDAQYKQWLNEDVVYIIAPEERTAFLQLSTSEEREQFIEQYWLRRSSNPDLPENDVKEEHYRRIAYANEHYASGIPGWKTDRGRTYIIWGPADEVDSHPTGGTYDRPMNEGGGSTSTYPWEMWRYRYLEGIGNNVEIEFVDPSGSGEYHMTMDPSEKDALTHVPGAGLSLMESMGMATKADRFTRSDGTNLPTTMGGQPASMNEFTRLEQFAKIQQAPPVKIKDLHSVNVGVVNSRLQVPRYQDEKLEASSLILADQIEHVPAKQIGAGQFVLGSSKVRPRLEGDFTTADKLGIYMQVYNLKPDDTTHKSSATFQYTVKKGDQQVMQFKETSGDMKQTGDQVTIERLLPLGTLTPGKYTLEVSATDSLANQTILRTAEFTVKPPSAVPTKTAANTAPGR